MAVLIERDHTRKLSIVARAWLRNRIREVLDILHDPMGKSRVKTLFIDRVARPNSFLAAAVIVAALFSSCDRHEAAQNRPLLSDSGDKPPSRSRASDFAVSVHPTFPDVPSVAPADAVTLKYDKFREEWFEISKHEQLQQQTPAGAYDVTTRPLALYVNAVLVRHGHKPPMPRGSDNVELIFTSEAADWQFLQDHTLRLIVDGRRYVFETARSSQVAPLQETLLAEVPLDAFLAIATASNAEGQLGRHDFVVPGDCLTALRTFASPLPFDPSVLQSRVESEGRSTQLPTNRQTSPKSLSRDELRARWPEQVYVDFDKRVYYPVDCKNRPPYAARMPKTFAVRQMFVPSPQCP